MQVIKISICIICCNQFFMIEKDFEFEFDNIEAVCRVLLLLYE